MLRKIKERRSFLLSECLVACVLISLLLGSLGYWTRRIWVSHKEKERSYKTFLLDANNYRLLRDVFLSTFVLEEGNELVFSFDRGVYIDPDLAGVVRGRFLYDPMEQTLSLVIASEREEERQEILPLWTQVLSAEWKVFRQQECGGKRERVCLTLVRKVGTLSPRTLFYVFAVGG